MNKYTEIVLHDIEEIKFYTIVFMLCFASLAVVSVTTFIISILTKMEFKDRTILYLFLTPLLLTIVFFTITCAKVTILDDYIIKNKHDVQFKYIPEFYSLEKIRKRNEKPRKYKTRRQHTEDSHGGVGWGIHNPLKPGKLSFGFQM